MLARAATGSIIFCYAAEDKACGGAVKDRTRSRRDRKLVAGREIGHARGMLMRYSNNGGQAKLWCVELVPKKKKFGDAEMKRAVDLAKGMPSDPDKALFWMAEIMAGLLPP